MGSSFRNLMDNLGELSTLTSRVSAAVAGDINGFLAGEFADERDPYDEDWAPLAEGTVIKKGHDRIMVETGETMNTTRAYPMAGAGIEIRSTQKAGYNQFEGHAPARPVLPSEADLPEKWQESIEKRYAEALARSRSKK